VGEIVAAMKANPPADQDARLIFAEALARSGDVSAARRELAAVVAAAATRYVREDLVAAAYLTLGDTGRTLEWLDRGLTAEAANMAWINRTWRFQGLHGDPRFAAIVQRAGLHLLH
jgi:hypothetical protein